MAISELELGSGVPEKRSTNLASIEQHQMTQN